MDTLKPELYKPRYLNVAHVKHYIKERAGLRVGHDYLEALDRKIERLIDSSLTGFNRFTKRKTLKAEDLIK